MYALIKGTGVFIGVFSSKKTMKDIIELLIKEDYEKNSGPCGNIGDGKTHIYTIAEYINANDAVICKWQDEDLDNLLDLVKEWNESHRISNDEGCRTFWKNLPFFS